MADEQNRWLNRDAVERLLRGEPLEAVDADTRARADRLAEALDALTAELSPPTPQNTELPGEEAALAAFRMARTAGATRVGSTTGPARAARSGRDGEAAGPGGGGRPDASPLVADAGLVRLGRPERPVPDGGDAGWGRSVRFGLAAALAAGMLGGVAVAAGSGALSAFRDDEPEPTVSAAHTPDRPSPGDKERDDHKGMPGDPPPESFPGGSTKGDAPTGDSTGGEDENEQPRGTGQDGNPARERWNSVLSACRDVRDGKGLDVDRRRGLEDAAGGGGGKKLKRYCEDVLAGGADKRGSRPGAGTGTSGSGPAGSVGGGDDAQRSGKDSDEEDDPDRGERRGGHGKGGWNSEGDGKRDGNHRSDGTGDGNGENKRGRKGKGGNGHRGQGGVARLLGAGGPADVSASPAAPSSLAAAHRPAPPIHRP
ncbi:hypothetical protein WBG99_12645 [Streptomyces sp. TG1A-60]|uniref:hypothetical protein n=1 Tax=Streptomyces sp. TG1A-60 TaxID=3129111 RepID=UPI0030D390FE